MDKKWRFWTLKMKLNFFRLEPLNSAMEQPMEQLGTLWRVVCKITTTFGTELWKSLWNCPVASFHPALNCHNFGTTIGTHFCNLWAKLIVEWKDLLRMKLWSQLKAHQWRYVTLHTLCTKEIFIEPHVAIAKASQHAVRRTLRQNPTFCSKIKVLTTSILARKFKFTVGIDFIKIEFLDKNLRFCHSV